MTPLCYIMAIIHRTRVPSVYIIWTDNISVARARMKAMLLPFVRNASENSFLILQHFAPYVLQSSLYRSRVRVTSRTCRWVLFYFIFFFLRDVSHASLCDIRLRTKRFLFISRDNARESAPCNIYYVGTYTYIILLQVSHAREKPFIYKTTRTFAYVLPTTILVQMCIYEGLHL